MKRLGISVSVIVLAALVLLGSGGFTVGKMICGGNECSSTYTLGAAKDCCDPGNAPETSVSKDCCCELINVSYSLDDFSISEKTNVSSDRLHVFTLPKLPSLHSSFAIRHFSFFTDPSPPDPQDHLIFIRSLLL